MIDEAKLNELIQAEEMAYFRGELCEYSPESSTPEERREIAREMHDSGKALLDAMRADFEQQPPEIRQKVLDMLCTSGYESSKWWRDVLTGNGDARFHAPDVTD